MQGRTKERRQAACWLWRWLCWEGLSGGTLEQAVGEGSEGAPWIVRGIRIEAVRGPEVRWCPCVGGTLDLHRMGRWWPRVESWEAEPLQCCGLQRRSCFTQSEVSLAGLGRSGCTPMGKSDHENPKFSPLLDTPRALLGCNLFMLSPVSIAKRESFFKDRTIVMIETIEINSLKISFYITCTEGT